MCITLQRFQKKSEDGLRRFFEHWASFVSRCGVFTALLTAVMCLYLRTGLQYKERFVSKESWAPAVSLRLQSDS